MLLYNVGELLGVRLNDKNYPNIRREYFMCKPGSMGAVLTYRYTISFDEAYALKAFEGNNSHELVTRVV